MNVLEKCMDDLRRVIPIEILQIAFKDDLQNIRRAPISLREQIMLKVVRPRFLLDCDIVGGQTVILSLENLQARYLDTYTIIYEIPKEMTNYRTIMSVLSIGYLPYAASYNSLSGGNGTINPASMSDVMSAGQRVGDSLSNIPNISNASVDLIGENTILIRDMLRVTNAYQLRCTVGHEENLNDIQPRLYHIYARGIELAVKSYIYNTLIVKIDQAYLQGGQELGKIKDIVESYADAEQMYRDYILNNIQVASMFNQTSMGHDRFIRLQINPAL